MAIHKGELIAGGSFLAAGGKTSARFARWAPVEPTAEINQWRSSRYHRRFNNSELAVRIDASATHRPADHHRNSTGRHPEGCHRHHGPRTAN
jgi:hypothetical protein